MKGMPMLDSKNLGQLDGFDLRVEVHQDTYVKPEDFDTYDRETIEAFARDMWQFVMLRVVASKRGITLGEAWLGGMEHGWLPQAEDGPTQTFTNAMNRDDEIVELAGEALELAKSELTALAA